MPDVTPKRYRQSSVIPYRRREGRLEVLLITSMGRGDWIVPKGLVEPGMTEPDSAAKEAWEEAGVEGPVGTRVVGVYEYAKWGGICSVSVFDLEVQTEHADWPERHDRRRRWAGVDEAVKLVTRPAVAELIRTLPDRVPSAS